MKSERPVFFLEVPEKREKASEGITARAGGSMRARIVLGGERTNLEDLQERWGLYPVSRGGDFERNREA